MKTNAVTALLVMILVASSQVFPFYGKLATSAALTPSPTPAPVTSPSPTDAPTNTCKISSTPNNRDDLGTDIVKLYYLREAVNIKRVLQTLLPTNLCISTVTDDQLILYGTARDRMSARRTVAALDLPRPGINLEMWGIQISSPDPDKMARVMIHVREIIKQTQTDVRETYLQLQKAVLQVIPDDKLDKTFKLLLTDDLGYEAALDANRTFSLTDLLLRMTAADDPAQAAADVANMLDKFGKEVQKQQFKSWKDDPKEQKKHKQYLALLPNNRIPFKRFFRLRGLTPKKNSGTECNTDEDSCWTSTEEAKATAWRGRAALLDFALNYARFVHEPQKFSPYHLQRSAGVVNDRLQNTVDALNADMEDLFLVPALIKIQSVVADFKDVDYAQVGKTTVASLSGVKTTVTSKAVSAFDVTPPLSLSAWLTKAETISNSVATFDPAENVVGALPLTRWRYYARDRIKSFTVAGRGVHCNSETRTSDSSTLGDCSTSCVRIM
ncbi:MAG: hypothetical protein R2682_03540 [Pyrinomonadaceae bacterium]